jgi:LysR family glycine cleavage system transcriptional activator
LGHVRDVLASLKQRDVNRTLTIACSHDLAQNWLMPRFRQLAELLSDWKLRVITAASYEDFDAGDIDLSIRFGDGNWPGFTPFTCLRKRHSRSVRPHYSSAIRNC